MKNIFFICFCALFAFSGCADDDDELLTGGNIDVDLLPDTKPNDVVNTKVFDMINLNYPGLEKVKEFYEAGEYYYAANSLLDYYRTRTNVTNPSLSLINVTITEADRKKADYAMDNYRLHVNNFYEDASTLKPYSVKKDATINWEFSPEGASDEYQKQLHRHQWFIPQAKAYRVSGNEKYISSWIEVYKNWIENNPKPETGTNTTSWWQLQVATRVSEQVQLIEYFKNSVNFTPEWLTIFLVKFAEQADFLVQYPYNDGNILISQANALAYAGTLMPEFKNAETWMNTGYKILGEQVQSQILSDGWHKELSLHYHTGIVADFYEAMKLAEANQLAGKLPSNFTEPLRKAAEVVMYFTYPNYFKKGSDNVVPMFNDSWSRTRNVLKNTNFKQYVEMFPDSEELKYMQTAGNGETAHGRTPGNDMKLFDQAGFYVLRNGWAPTSTVMIFSNNTSNDISNSLSAYSHNQPDNGTFELYHNGRNFFPDSGVCTYYTSGGNNDLRYWFRGIDKHNTMSLNKSNIKAAAGKLLVSKEGSTEMVVFENQGYDNLKHRRAVFYVNKAFIVLVDEGIGTAENKVNLSFNLCEGSNSEVIVDKANNGVHTAFADGNNIVVRTFANKNVTCSPFTGRIAYLVDGNYNERSSYTIDMDKKADETARYITVILPVNGNTDTTTIDAQFTDQGYSDKGASVNVTVNGTDYPLSYELN